MTTQETTYDCRRAGTHVLPFATLVLLCAISMLSGCSKKQAKPEVITLEGKVESIKRSSNDTGTITVSFYNNEQERETVGTGEVTSDTEILIDGAVATLADVREGDHVRGDVRVEKRNGKRLQTVVRVSVERPK